MIFYQECLGGELAIQKVSESPMAADLPSEAGAHVLHSALVKDNLVLMASDMIGAALVKGNDISLCLNCQHDDELATIFTRLSDGGEVKTPLHQSFWGATYGELTDRYGVNWMLNFSRDQKV